MDKQDIRQFSQNELSLFFIENNFPKYRANQVYEWIWKHYKLDFDFHLKPLLKTKYSPLQPLGSIYLYKIKNHFHFQ